LIFLHDRTNASGPELDRSFRPDEDGGSEAGIAEHPAEPPPWVKPKRRAIEHAGCEPSENGAEEEHGFALLSFAPAESCRPKATVFQRVNYSTSSWLARNEISEGPVSKFRVRRLATPRHLFYRIEPKPMVYHLRATSGGLQRRASQAPKYFGWRSVCQPEVVEHHIAPWGKAMKYRPIRICVPRSNQLQK
jgi:hypothetical protein